MSLSWLPPLRLHDELLIIGYEARLHLTHTIILSIYYTRGNIYHHASSVEKITGKGSFLCDVIQLSYGGRIHQQHQQKKPGPLSCTALHRQRHLRGSNCRYNHHASRYDQPPSNMAIGGFRSFSSRRLLATTWYYSASRNMDISKKHTSLCRF